MSYIRLRKDHHRRKPTYFLYGDCNSSSPFAEIYSITGHAWTLEFYSSHNAYGITTHGSFDRVLIKAQKAWIRKLHDLYIISSSTWAI